MPKDKRGRTRLSKSVLEMKFMQRTKNRIRAEQEAEESRKMYGKEISKKMQNASDKFVLERSYIPIHKLVVGRMSYGGFNPEVEKFMTKPAGAPEPQETGEMDKEISDEEMAEFSNTLGRTMANKFDKSKKKRKFMKPEDD